MEHTEGIPYHNIPPYILLPIIRQGDDNKVGIGLELQILKGTHFKTILKGQLRAPRPLHVKEYKNKKLIF